MRSNILILALSIKQKNYLLSPFDISITMFYGICIIPKHMKKSIKALNQSAYPLRDEFLKKKKEG